MSAQRAIDAGAAGARQSHAVGREAWKVAYVAVIGPDSRPHRVRFTNMAA